MFPAIRAAGLDLVALGERMARRKEELVFELAEQQFDEEIARPAGISLWARVRGVAMGMAVAVVRH